MIEKIYKVMFPHDNTVCEYDDTEALKQDLIDMGLPLSLMDFPDDVPLGSKICIEPSTAIWEVASYENECDGCKVWVEIHDYR